MWEPKPVRQLVFFFELEFGEGLPSPNFWRGDPQNAGSAGTLDITILLQYLGKTPGVSKDVRYMHHQALNPILSAKTNTESLPPYCLYRVTSAEHHHRSGASNSVNKGTASLRRTFKNIQPGRLTQHHKYHGSLLFHAGSGRIFTRVCTRDARRNQGCWRSGTLRKRRALLCIFMLPNLIFRDRVFLHRQHHGDCMCAATQHCHPSYRQWRQDCSQQCPRNSPGDNRDTNRAVEGGRIVKSLQASAQHLTFRSLQRRETKCIKCKCGYVYEYVCIYIYMYTRAHPHTHPLSHTHTRTHIHIFEFFFNFSNFILCCILLLLVDLS